MVKKKPWYGTGGMLPCNTDIISLPRSPGNLSQHQCCPQCHILQTPKLERYDQILSESLNIYLTEDGDKILYGQEVAAANLRYMLRNL